MRNRAQIAKLLYDNLSNSAWSRLRKAFLSQELIAIGTDIIYKYEIKAHATPWNPGVHTRSDYRTAVATALSDWATGPVKEAVIDWATEVLYQAYLAAKKNYEDQTVSTASYVGLIEKSLGLTNRVPVSQCKPATITVMLPVGTEVYPPYSVSISCGSAQFWNIKTYRSGEQATLYQGVPYYYGTDISGLAEASVFDGTMFSIDEDRYVKLTANTYPESVQVYSVSDTYHLYNPQSSLQKFPAFKVWTSRDGSIETHFSNGGWGTGDVNFRPDAEDWCIRFLDLTSTEFDITTVILPEGYTLLSSEQANFTDMDYARRYFCKWQYMFDGQVGTNFENLKYFITSIPDIQDCSILNSGIIYIKPVKTSENLIFDEVESFLNTYYVQGSSSIDRWTTLCGYARDFTVQVEILNSDKFSAELKSRIAAYLKEKYAYDQLSFVDSVQSADIKSDIQTLFGLGSGDFNVTLLVGQRVCSSFVDFVDPFKSDTAQMQRDGVITTYSYDNTIYQLQQLSATGVTVSDPHVSLASCWGYNSVTTLLKASVNYNLKSTEYHAGDMPFTSNDTIWDAFGLRANEQTSTIGTQTTTLRVFSTSQSYFLNPPRPEDFSSFPTPFMSTTDDDSITALRIALNNKPFTYDTAVADHTMYSLVYDSTNWNYKINKYWESAGHVAHAYGVFSFPLPSTPTYVSYYNDDVYVSCESAQIVIIKRLSEYMDGTIGNWSVATDLFVYGVYDSESKVVESCDQLPWSFNKCSMTSIGSDTFPDFYACVGADGGMTILTLDSEDPGTSMPAGVASSGEQASALWNSYTDNKKKQINSKWHFYNVDRFKITAKGIQTINMREIATLPTFTACNEGVAGLTSWVALRYGYWTLSGRGFGSNMGVTSAYQTYVQRASGGANYSLLNSVYYDLVNDITSKTDSAVYNSNPNFWGNVLSSVSILVGSAAPNTGTVTLTAGSYGHNRILVVADNAETTVADVPSYYLEMSDDIVKWI